MAERSDAHIEQYQAGNPVTGEAWITVRIRDQFFVTRAHTTTPLDRRWATGDEIRAAVDEALVIALADPEFATRLDWAKRYASTNQRAAEYLANHDNAGA